MEQLEFSKKYRIPVYEMGFNGKLSPHSLFNYLQDIASEHAELLRFGKDDLLKENRFWVLSRIAVKVIYWPSWGESIDVKTWPRGTDKLFALRDFEVTDSHGESVALGSSSWLVVDRTSRRVQRPDSVLSHFNEGFPVKSAISGNASKVGPVAGDAVHSQAYRVAISDLDINLHVNNVKYLEWITDSYDLEFRQKHNPSFIEINYLAESRIGEEIIIATSAGKNNEALCNHSVIRTVDNTELCRAQIHWEICPQ
ncbi:MAG TPA: acyl-ACP thioesterase domain-containing protein [Bacteroidales bacterium]|nr:acyl-ACP thioesterase domain-containing protein [Bacteroidales bacterium]